MKSIVVLLAFLLFAGCGNLEDNLSSEKGDNEKNEKSEIPAAVADAFKAKYPGASDAEWEMEGDIYEVEFMLNDEEWEAEFNSAGKWMMTEQEIETAGLPDAVKKSIEEAYPGAELTEAESVDHSEYGNVYEVEIKVDGNEMELLINKEGKILSKDREDEGYKEEEENDDD